jgi:rhodanese-related sulfurtransferase
LIAVYFLIEASLKILRANRFSHELEYLDELKMFNFYVKNLLKYWGTFMKLIFRKCWIFNKCWSEITVSDLNDHINSSEPPLILDIRSIEEFNGSGGHIPNAKSIPINKLKSTCEDLQSFKEKEIVTICPGGGLSLIAVDILNKAGFLEAKSLHGGLDLWEKNGYPITTS